MKLISVIVNSLFVAFLITSADTIPQQKSFSCDIKMLQSATDVHCKDSIVKKSIPNQIPTGLIIDQTRTEAGKAFYDCFFNNWKFTGIQFNYYLTITDKLLSRQQ